MAVRYDPILNSEITKYVKTTGDRMTGKLSINTNSTTALLIERDGVKDNVLVVDTANGIIGINRIPTAGEAPLQIVGTNGEIRAQSNLTDATNKNGRFTVGHYTNAEEPLLLVVASSTNTDGVLSWGGGSGVANSATIQRFYTASNFSTLTGTIALNINSGQLVTVGVTAGTGRFNVIGSSDIVQAIVKAHSTQTTNLQEWQNSSGTVLGSIDNNGNWGFGTAPSTQKLKLLVGYTDITSSQDAVLMSTYFNANTVTNTGLNRGLYVYTPTQGTQNFSGSVRSIAGEYYHYGSGTVTTAYGLNFAGGTMSTGNITNLALARLALYGTGSGVISNVYGLSIGNLSANGSATYQIGIDLDANTGANGTYKYGLRVGNVSGATNNYAIYTGTGLNRLGDQLSIVGSADRQQLIVKGNAAQTANLQEWQNSSGTVLGSISGIGNVGLGIAPDAYNKIYSYNSTADTSANITRAGFFEQRFAPTSAARTAEGGAIQAVAYIGAATQNVTEMWGLSGAANVKSTAGTIIVGSITGLKFYTGNESASATVTSARGIQIQPPIGTGTITNSYALYANNQGRTNVTNAYGIYLENQSNASTLNYAIYTNAGNISLNSGNDASTTVRVGGATNNATFESDGTLVFNGTATVYQDANVGSLVLQTGGTLPGIVEWLNSVGGATGIYTRGFAVGEKGGGSIEVPHDYKEGSNLTFHVHWGINDAPTGTDNVKWQLTYSVSRDGVAFPSSTAIVVETAVDTQYKCMRSDFTAITGTNFKIGDQFNFQLERIASVGDAFAGEALVMTLGFHYECDTLGSRAIASK